MNADVAGSQDSLIVVLMRMLKEVMGELTRPAREVAMRLIGDLIKLLGELVGVGKEISAHVAEFTRRLMSAAILAPNGEFATDGNLGPGFER